MRFVRAKKSLGQHFLTNPRIAGEIADAAHITPGETVFEIGPGTGMLTRELLQRAARVRAIEADARAVAVLEEVFAREIEAGTLMLVHGDIRHARLEDLGLVHGGYKCVANIPYYLSGMLFEKILAGNVQPSTVVFLVQKEVAERIARENKESILSLSIKAYGEPRYIKTVARGNFQPVPNVDSAILAIEHISKRHFSNLDETFFFLVVKKGFASRRKQLFGNMRTILPDRESLAEVFEEQGIEVTVRGEDLSVERWLSLARALKQRLSTREK